MKDAASQLRTATRRAKSDVANKLVSMFLHELSRTIGQTWRVRVDGNEYESLVRESFHNKCPYCSRELDSSTSVIEHLDGMNRYRVGLHIPGNVLVACKKCNSEKRRDDSMRELALAESGWESFLSHDGTRCESICQTCQYWKSIWENEAERSQNLLANLQAIRQFRTRFPELQAALPKLAVTLPELLSKLYVDCQVFAEREMRSLLERYLEAPVATSHDLPAKEMPSRPGTSIPSHEDEPRRRMEPSTLQEKSTAANPINDPKTYAESRAKAPVQN